MGVACVRAGTAHAAPVPEVTVIRAEQPPRIDGRLDDACWQGAPLITDFRCNDPARSLPTQRTEAWVVCDDDALYVAAKCHEDRMDLVQAVETGFDGRVWRDDCLEVFLMPSTPYYYHFAANLLGTRYDARHDVEAGNGETTPERWDAEWRVGAQRGESYWSMEIAIPLACLEWGPERVAAPLRLNIGREQHRLAEFSCWPASEFSKVEEFAVLEGLTVDPRRYGLVLRDMSVGEMAPGPNRFSATVEEETASGTPITLRARVQPLPQGQIREYTAHATSAPGAGLNVDYQVPVAGGRVAVTVECLDGRGKARTSYHEVLRVPAPVEASLDLPLLYQSDTHVRVSGRVALPASLRRGAKLQAALICGGRRLTAVSVPLADGTGRFLVQLPVNELPAGRYAVETRLTAPALGAEPITSQFPFRLIAGPFD